MNFFNAFAFRSCAGEITMAYGEAFIYASCSALSPSLPFTLSHAQLLVYSLVYYLTRTYRTVSLLYHLDNIIRITPPDRTPYCIRSPKSIQLAAIRSLAVDLISPPYLSCRQLCMSRPVRRSSRSGACQNRALGDLFCGEKRQLDL
jgi:hypothetical protein